MKKVFLLLALLACINTNAQDVIVKKDGSTILSKVLEVNPEDVKYKKFSNKTGPTYTIRKSEILSINYENGEKDLFDNSTENDTNQQNGLSTGLIIKTADKKNDELLAIYNRIYQPTKKVRVNKSSASECIVIFGVKQKSILSNEDVEIRFVKDPDSHGSYRINISNKTNRTIYIDKGNCFRLNYKGETFCYYDTSEQTTINMGDGSGASIGLGSVAGALGVGGTVGQIAGGVIVGGGTSHSTSTTYSQQRIIAIPPHGNKNLTEYKRVQTKEGNIWSESEYKTIETTEEFLLNQCVENFWWYSHVWEVQLPRGVVKNGEVKVFSENEIPWKREYFFTYSTEQDFKTYTTMNVEFFIHEIIGGAAGEDNAKKIKDSDEYTINSHMDLKKK